MPRLRQDQSPVRIPLRVQGLREGFCRGRRGSDDGEIGGGGQSRSSEQEHFSSASTGTSTNGVFVSAMGACPREAGIGHGWVFVSPQRAQRTQRVEGWTSVNGSVLGFGLCGLSELRRVLRVWEFLEPVPGEVSSTSTSTSRRKGACPWSFQRRPNVAAPVLFNRAPDLLGFRVVREFRGSKSSAVRGHPGACPQERSSYRERFECEYVYEYERRFVSVAGAAPPGKAGDGYGWILFHHRGHREHRGLRVGRR